MKKQFFLLLCCSVAFRIYGVDITVFANKKPWIFWDIDFRKFPDGTHRINAVAEQDFKKYFRQITGCALPVVQNGGLIPLRARIVVNKNFDVQDCRIDISEKEIMLTAVDTLGVVNGLYTLLDHWRCRWILPGEMGEVIPRCQELKLAAGTMNFTNAMDSRVESSWKQGDDHPVWRLRNRRGAKHRLTAQHYWLHAIPPNKYFKDHPEYFALIGGRRIPSQLCSSNTAVRELMVQKALEYFKMFPANASFPMDPADGFDHCQCRNCVALDDPGVKNEGYPCVSNRVTGFANFVAERIADKYPDKKIGFYAYANKKTPPSVKMHPALFVPYTRDSSSLLHLMPDQAVPSSLEYWELLEKWQKVCANMYAYEYDPISWTGSLLCPIYLERARALQKQHSMGIKGVITDLGSRADASLFVNRYLEARFKADPTLDPVGELTAMCKAFFGPAGDFMTGYYLALAKVTDCKSDIRFGIDGYERLFTPEMIRRARKFLEQALVVGKRSNDPMLGRRLKMVELAQNYLESYLNFIWNLKKGDFRSSSGDSEAIFRAIDALYKENPAYIDPAGAKRRINTAVKKNMAKFFPDKYGFIRTWKLAGPFDNGKRDAIVNDGNIFASGVVSANLRTYTSKEGFIDFTGAFAKDVRSGEVYYAYAMTDIYSLAAVPVQLLTDSFYPFKVWLNGQLVYSRDNMDADCPDKRQINVQLRSGNNKIAVMVAQALPTPFNRWGFWLRIADLKGDPIDPSKHQNSNTRELEEVKAAIKLVKSTGNPNLVPKANLEKISSVRATSFGVWPPSIKSKVTLDQSRACSGKNSIRFRNVTDGSLNRFFPVNPGEKYLLGFSCFNPGRGNCFLSVSWRGKGKFLSSKLNRSFFPAGSGSWRKVSGIVTVPENADQLTFCVSVTGQGVDDMCFVDDLLLHKLP